MKAIGITQGREPTDDVLPLDEQAYRRLRQALVEGTFVPGEKLAIRRVAEALGTSPMPARTALGRLIAEQALDALPSGTAIVPRLTREAFLEMGAIRAALEPLAVRLAAPHVTKPVIRRLDALRVEHDRAAGAGEPDRFLQVDREFLFTLYRLAGAPTLLGMIEAMWLRRGPLFWEARWVLLGRPREKAHRHVEIVAALRAGQGDVAAQELGIEIKDTTAFLLEEMRFQGDGSAMPLNRLRRGQEKPGSVESGG